MKKEKQKIEKIVGNKDGTITVFTKTKVYKSCLPLGTGLTGSFEDKYGIILEEIK